MSARSVSLDVKAAGFPSVETEVKRKLLLVQKEGRVGGRLKQVVQFR
jgi:hypothetical protein